MKSALFYNLVSRYPGDGEVAFVVDTVLEGLVG